DRLLLDQLQEEPQLRTNAGSCYRLGVETAYYDRAIQAMEVYSQGLAIQPDHFWCRFGLGRIQAKQGRLAEARTALAAAATLAPADPYLLWDFTQDLVSVGLPDRAVGSAQTLVGLDPNYWGNWQLLSKALLASGKPDAAVEALRSAVAHSPISLSPDVQLGDLLRELGRTEEAALVYQAMSTRGDRGKSRANRDLLRIAASRLTGLGVRRS
ncbi:MAG: tetratricopeptide repeat protein, partial [Armatimonadetes bacterium]|nr:tetratricopeptide repeat protein [Armatimonadota bacterium]